MDKIKIEDVCDILNGFAFKSDNYVDKGIRIIRIANVQKGYIEDSAPAFYPLNSTGLDKYMLEKGDLLISLTGNVGRVAILQEEMLPAALNQRVACLRIKSEKISKGYLFHILNSDFFERKCIQSAKGVAQKNMSTEWLKNYRIPLYSTEQQSEIVSVLDTLQSIICNRKYELLKLDDLIKARFVEMFGNGHDGFCNTKKLGEFCKFQQGTQIPVEEQIEEQLEGYTRFLRIIDYTQAPQIPRYVSVKGREIAEDSVVIVRYGATAGFVGHGYAGILANNLFEVVPDESILSKDFLYLALKYGTFEQEVHDKAFGAAMPALSFGMMNDIGVVTPNSTAQNGFVDFVKQVDKSKLLSGCRLFHSWAPENRDKPKHVGVPQRKTKVLREGRRQQ